MSEKRVPALRPERPQCFNVSETDILGLPTAKAYLTTGAHVEATRAHITHIEEQIEILKDRLESLKDELAEREDAHKQAHTAHLLAMLSKNDEDKTEQQAEDPIVKTNQDEEKDVSDGEGACEIKESHVE